MSKKKNKQALLIIFSFAILFIYACLVTDVAAQVNNRADYLIIYTPSSAGLLNKYEQNLNNSERALLPSGIPLKIIEYNTQLSDGYTQAHRLEYDNQNYFLSTSTIDKMLADNQANLIKSVIVVADTIMILESDRLKFTHPSKKSETAINLSSGVQLIRLFRKGSQYYTMLTGANKRFGWVTLPNKRYWVKSDQKAGITRSASSDDTFKSIVMRVEKTNAIFRDTFQILNRRTGRNENPPQWISDQQEKALHLRFNPIEYASAFSESNNRFVQEISLYLLGSKYRLEKSENPIHITIYAPHNN